jgi:hypothetical protein
MCGWTLLLPDVYSIHHNAIGRWLQIVENGHGQLSKIGFMWMHSLNGYFLAK